MTSQMKILTIVSKIQFMDYLSNELVKIEAKSSCLWWVNLNLSNFLSHEKNINTIVTMKQQE